MFVRMPRQHRPMPRNSPGGRLVQQQYLDRNRNASSGVVTGISGSATIAIYLYQPDWLRGYGNQIDQCAAGSYYSASSFYNHDLCRDIGQSFCFQFAIAVGNNFVYQYTARRISKTVHRFQTLTRCINVTGFQLLSSSQITEISVTVNVSHQRDHIEFYLRFRRNLNNVANGTYAQSIVAGQSIALFCR